MHMTPDELIALAMTFLGIVLIPLLGLVIRVVIKMTRAEDKLNAVAESMKKLVEDKDKVHSEMLAQMRDDRKASDERLRYLERYVWRKQGRAAQA